MITGTHVVLYSKDPDADRAFLRDVLGLPNVDVGGGWLIFGLPPSEAAVHPSEKNDVHEFFLICDDVEAFAAEMAGRGISCGPLQTPGWGVLTHLTLPGGGRLGVYEPRHARPRSAGARRPAGRRRRPPAKRRTAAKASAKPKKRRRSR